MTAPTAGFYVHDTQFTYLYVYGLQFTTEQAVTLDATIDDGNIATGDVRIAIKRHRFSLSFPLGPGLRRPSLDGGLSGRPIQDLPAV